MSVLIGSPCILTDVFRVFALCFAFFLPFYNNTPSSVSMSVSTFDPPFPFQVKALLEVQTDTLDATKRQVDKKQTRTVEERDQEIQEEEQGALPEFNEVCSRYVCVQIMMRRCPLALGAFFDMKGS